MSLLELKNVGLDISTNTENKSILKDISMTFEAGKIYVITGPNGGGKSTLAKCIMGIQSQNTGEILMEGKDISKFDIVERNNSGIGYAFQTPARFKGLKVGKLLELAKGESKITVNRALLDVGLNPEEYVNRSIDNSFSGGELKRIELASILIQDLKVAMFDEPEAGIDLWSFKLLVRTFKRLNKLTDTCIIIISHQERIMELADEIIIVDNGEIAKKTVRNRLIGLLNKDDLRKCELTCCERGELCEADK